MSDGSKLCATLERIEYKPGKLQDSIEIMHEIEAEIRAIPGRKHLISVWNDDGVEYVLNIWESPEAKTAGTVQANRLAEKFGDKFKSFEALDFEHVYYLVGK